MVFNKIKYMHKCFLKFGNDVLSIALKWCVNDAELTKLPVAANCVYVCGQWCY